MELYTIIYLTQLRQRLIVQDLYESQKMPGNLSSNLSSSEEYHIERMKSCGMSQLPISWLLVGETRQVLQPSTKGGNLRQQKWIEINLWVSHSSGWWLVAVRLLQLHMVRVNASDRFHRHQISMNRLLYSYTYKISLNRTFQRFSYMLHVRNTS